MNKHSSFAMGLRHLQNDRAESRIMPKTLNAYKQNIW